MRISDWSSDVCSSDLQQEELLAPEPVSELAEEQRACAGTGDVHRTGQAHVEVAQAQPGALRFERSRHRADDGHLETIENPRSEERRVGKECVSTCRSRWSPYHSKKKKQKNKPK